MNERNALYQQTLSDCTLLSFTNISACVLLTTLLLKVICFADGGCGLLLFSTAMERPMCTTAEPFNVNSMTGNTSALLESRCGTIRNLCWFSSICYCLSVVLRREKRVQCDAWWKKKKNSKKGGQNEENIKDKEKLCYQTVAKVYKEDVCGVNPFSVCLFIAAIQGKKFSNSIRHLKELLLLKLMWGSKQ